MTEELLQVAPTVKAPPSGRARLPLLGRLASLSGPVLGLIFVLGLFIILIGAKKNGAAELLRFLSLSNLQVLVNQGTLPAVVALGALLIILSGGIDLSVGSVVALVTVVTMRVYQALDRGPASEPLASLLAVAAGVVTGGLAGFVNGLIVTRLRVLPFVATLGTMQISRGLAVLLAGRQILSFSGARPAWVDALAQVHAGAMIFNPGFWSLLLLAVVVAVMLRYTVLGRHCYAIGSNEATARLCGVAIDRTKVIVYTLAGLLTGWAGILMFAQQSSGNMNAGEQLELFVIAAVVIGGASLSGGQGTVVGTLLGVLILEVLGNGVNTFDVPVEVQYMLIGIIIIANTALSHWQRTQRGG